MNTSDVSSTKPYSDIEVRTLNAGKGRDDEHLTLELNENVTEDNSNKVIVTLVKSDKIEVTTDKKSKGITDNVTIDKKLTGVTKKSAKIKSLEVITVEDMVADASDEVVEVIVNPEKSNYKRKREVYSRNRIKFNRENTSDVISYNSPENLNSVIINNLFVCYYIFVFS